MEARVKGFTIVTILVIVSVIGGWIYEEQAWHPGNSDNIRYGSFEYQGTASNGTQSERLDATVTLTSSTMKITINGQTESYDIPDNLKDTWHLERSGDIWYDGNGRSHETTDFTDGKGSYYTISENGYIVSVNGEMNGIRVNLTLDGWHH